MNILLIAIENRDLLEVTRLLNLGKFDLEHDDSVFVRAIQTHQFDMLQLLIQYEINRGHVIKDRCNRIIQGNYTLEEDRTHTLLGLTAKYRYTEMTHILLEHGADPNISDIHGMTPLLYEIGLYYNTTTAMLNGVVQHHCEVMQLLLDHGTNVNIPCSRGWSPLHYAVENNSATTVQFLLEHEASVDVYNNFKSPLYMAVRRRNKAIIKLLLEAGASIEMQDGQSIKSFTNDSEIITLIEYYEPLIKNALDE